MSGPSTLPSSSSSNSFKSFTDFGNRYFDRRITKAITSILKFTSPSLIQSKMIPIALEGRDMLVRGRTGSGKTLGYAIPVIQRLLQKKENSGSQSAHMRAIVLVPTKELCQQVYSVFSKLMHYCNDALTVARTTEAVDATLAHKLPSILVATPSGLLSFLKTFNKHHSRKLALRETAEIVVVDEADLMMSFGFKKEMEQIRLLLPTSTSSNYQVILCSATLNEEVHEMKSVMLYKPAVLKLEDDEDDGGKITEFYYKCAEEDKRLIVYSLLQLKLLPMKCLIFTSSIDRCYGLSLLLSRFSIASAVLSSLLPYSSRQNIIESFNQNAIEILIVTDDSMELEEADTLTNTLTLKEYRKAPTELKNDMDAEHFAIHRGLDLEGVGCVLNFDMPPKKKTYIHRIGRTARGGASGTSLTFCTDAPQEERLLKTLLKSSKNSLSANMEQEGMKAFQLDLNEVSCFRYRVNDISNSLTKSVIAEMKVQVLRKEILHSKQLSAHFADNPMDELALKKAVRHMKDKFSTNNQLHHIPPYLEATAEAVKTKSAVQLAIENQTDSTANQRPIKRHTTNMRSKSNGLSNPLKTFSAKRHSLASQLYKEPASYEMVSPEELPTLSGRNLWKLRHNKKLKKNKLAGNYLNKRNQKKFM